MRMNSMIVFIAVITLHVVIGGVMWLGGKDRDASLISKDDIPREKIIDNSDSPDTSNNTGTNDAHTGNAPTGDDTTPTVHIIKSGDALSRIANHYGISTQKLMAANDISDPNKIRIGQELIIPNN